MENITFDLPYKVKIVENKCNFSIVIITKNDEGNIENFQRNFQIFKEFNIDIYILDIGSTDNTINISKNFGYNVEDGNSFIRIIDEEMANIINDKFNKDDKPILKENDEYIDFSGARNYAASIAKTDMILMIDANCNLTFFNVVEIMNIINNSENKNIKFNFNKINKKYNICEFYNKNSFNWKNVVYEDLIQINDDKINIIDLDESTLRIDFYDYDRNTNLTGLALNTFLDPNNEKISQLFAFELKYYNYLRSSYQQFENHLNICHSDNIKKSITLTNMGEILINIDEVTKGLELYHKAYIECSDIRIHLYKLGEHFYSKGDWKKCIFYLEGCLNIPKIDNININDFVYADGPYSMLYVAYWWVGDKEKGKYYFDKALEINPFNKLYIDEANYHYKYIGNLFNGNLSFQELQFLYNKSSKMESILEIYPNSPRATHSLLYGCEGIVTVVVQHEGQIDEFLKLLEYPGNLRIFAMSTKELIDKIENEEEKFDMIFFNGNYYDIINDNNVYQNIYFYEKYANKLICGIDYESNKELINSSFEISGIDNNIWYKNISSFEKTTIYKRKK